MKNMMWTRLAIALAVLVVAGAGLFVWAPSSTAAVNIPPPGTIDVCAGFKSHPVRFPGGPIVTSTTTGGIQVQVGDHFVTSDSRNGANLNIQLLQSSGQVEGLGFVEVGIDSTRSAGASTVVANQKGSDYPATQTMKFFPTITIDGKEYRAIDAANLVNTSVASTPPPVGTTYVLTNEIRLESVDSPGKVALYIEPSKAFTVTGHKF
jgi:hypothetical protein